MNVWNGFAVCHSFICDGAEAYSFVELRKARDTELKAIEFNTLLKFMAQVDFEVIRCDLGW